MEILSLIQVLHVICTFFINLSDRGIVFLTNVVCQVKYVFVVVYDDMCMSGLVIICNVLGLYHTVFLH